MRRGQGMPDINNPGIIIPDAIPDTQKTGILGRLFYLVIWTAFILTPQILFALGLYVFIFHEMVVSVIIAAILSAVLIIYQARLYFQAFPFIFRGRHVTLVRILTYCAGGQRYAYAGCKSECEHYSSDPFVYYDDRGEAVFIYDDESF